MSRFQKGIVTVNEQENAVQDILQGIKQIKQGGNSSLDTRGQMLKM
jgi:hypothetical protein